jgi:predicted nucleic acid-binding protein
MLDNAVLDSSVIAAIFFDEEASIRAKQAAARHRPVIVDWTYAEVGNIAWKRITKFDEDADATLLSLKKCFEYLSSCSLIDGLELAEPALALSVEHKITFYDALYVAASEKVNAPLYTLDKKLMARAKNRNVHLI